jgi:hypothetical protein
MSKQKTQTAIDAKIIADIKKKLAENNGLVWKPKEGETVIGKVISITKKTFSEGGKSKRKIINNLIEVCTETGELKSFWSTTVIDTFLEREKVKAGDYIGITYQGKTEGKKMNYQRYNCVKY